MFLGCNLDQIPYLLSIKQLGFLVVGTDRNSDAAGAKLADKFYQASYTDIDHLRKIAVSEGFTPKDKIFTAAYHFAYEAAADIAEGLGIAYLSKRTVDICLDKSKFYEFLRSFDVPVPKTQLFEPLSPEEVDASKVYFLKSDYSKSSRFCYRIVNGKTPSLPDKFDIFYRKVFLLQEEVIGSHFRLNFYSGKVSVFLKLGSSASLGLLSLGVGHKIIVEKLFKVIESLGLTHYLVKFDLIINESGWYVIDVGLDPPFRLMLLSNYRGIDFEKAYVRYYLLNDQTALPDWPEIYGPVLISGRPGEDFTFTEFKEY